MIHPLLRNRKFWLLAGLALAAPLVLYKVLAQSTAPAPIDFENGPLIAKNNPSNVVLALSVEWPTSGGAYKDATYVDGKEYIGYFNSNRCYTYPGYANVPRTTSSFVVNSDYFTPTGNTSTSYQCNLSGTGTGFSGNYLNYATMSAPDMLRMALTGGDRGIDDQTLTVLDRGTVFSSANFRRAVGSTLTALVTPFNNGAALYAYNCRDEVIFTTSNTKTCANPDVADATDLRPVVASSVTASGTTTTTPTVPPINQVGTTWTDTGSYTLAAPTIGPVTPVTFYTTTFALTTTVPVAAAESPATVRTSTYTVSGTSTTAPLAAAETPAVIRGYAVTGTSTTTPPAAAESPAVVRGYVVNGTSTTAPPAAAESPSVIRGYTITGTTTAIPPTAAELVPVIRGFTYTVLGTSTVAPVGGAPVVVVGNIWAPSGALTLDYQGGGAPNTTNNFTVVTTGTRYCFLTAAPRRITLGPATGITSTNCSALGSSRSGSLNAGNVVVRYVNYTGTPIYNTYTATPFYNAYAPFYRSYAPFYYSYTAYYNSFTRNDFYYSYTSYTAYRVYKEQAVWNVYTATAKAIVKPRVQVCDSTEGPTRTVVYGTGTTDFYNYCTKYEVGGTVGYKPEGQIQQKSDSLRLAVFSYLMDGGTRDGGVLRAPMKYVGPNKYDDNGSLVTNPEKEWSVTTGQFVAKPITDSVSTSYTYTGVINYLNRFGKTGNYKSLDPVGELWYESLRYLQGLQPSAGTTDGMTDAMKDGYPVYSTWTDPVTSACQRRNYILGIGDTNTHYDRSIPGVTRAQQTTLFNESPNVYDITYATTPTINGSTDALDSHYWTQRVDAFERDGVAALTYTDALGRSQSTAGNLLRNNTLGNLDTTNTGSGGHSSYHWVGLSYWANTQAIRRDTKNGAVMDKVRVKTFMIDVDENNRGAIDANVKKTSYYLAGKYGYFDDKAENGNPFNGSDDSRWAETDGSPGGYVLASQPRRLIAGIKRFFDASARGGGSFATVAVSSNSFAANSRDGKSFEPSFVPGQWSGTIKSVELTLNTATNTLTGGSVTWDAGEILTAASRASGTVTLPQVRPQDRKIVTYLPGTTPASATFTWSELNTQVKALLNTTPYSSTTDALGEARVNYLRGDRTKELDETFRPRASIVGDIINSGPVFKGGANDEITGADYDAFVRNNLTRTPVVYTGANDGMLHAFNANTGQELFAYVPGALLPKLNVLTSKNYIHTAYVDAVPVVDEVKTSAGWRTILASGMGGGAQGIFALDVTNPAAFNKDNVMFEFTDRDDPMMGNVVAPPKLVKMLKQGTSPAVYEYYIVVSSGYNNYKPDGTGTFTLAPAQALFFLSVNKAIGTPWDLGTNYFKVELPANAAVGAAVGLAQPGIRFGSAGEAIEFFSGDLQGRLWKVGFSSGISAAVVAGTSPLLKPVYEPSPGVQRPLFTANIGTVTQAITSSPVIYPYATGGNMVIFGTGRLFEAADRSTTSLNSIYGVWDSGQQNSATYNRDRSNLQQMTINTTTLVISGSTPTFSASSTKSGWYLDLPRAKERVVIDGVASLGKVNINSTIPPASECSDNGDSLAYFLRPSNGTAALQTQGEIGGYRGKSINIEIDLSTATASSYSNRSNSGRRTATVKSASSTSVSTQNGTLSPKTYSVDSYLATGRIYWREIKDFNQTNP